ncbi:hypothetical protein B0H19DRAFT_683266 [Mycena capillaripes]|nr:hypothetical protein B0H19DRAFT_683266 [Mycena capillaripes]
MLHYFSSSCSTSALLSLCNSRTFTATAVSAGETDGVASPPRPRRCPARATSLASSPGEPLDGLEEDAVSRPPKGRPRRDTSFITPPSSALSRDEALQGEDAMGRRPRGRPRRDASLVTPPSSALLSDKPLDGQQEEDVLPPRPRGRPRRDASPTAPTSPLAGDDACDPDAPVLPQSRGRPRRETSRQIVGEEPDGPMLPTARGRPKREASPSLVREDSLHGVTAQDDTPKRPTGQESNSTEESDMISYHYYWNTKHDIFDVKFSAAARAEIANDILADWPPFSRAATDGLRALHKSGGGIEGLDMESDTDSTSDSESSGSESSDEWNSDSEMESDRKKEKN